jgi:TPR repeat protein
MLLRVIFAVAVMSAFAGTALADPLQDGEAAYRNGDVAAAFELLKPLAVQGDAEAQYDLGCLYENGDGVPQDSAGAVTWFAAAAERGMTAAEAVLGVMYSRRFGVPQDDALAGDWMRRAAEPNPAASPALASGLDLTQ